MKQRRSLLLQGLQEQHTTQAAAMHEAVAQQV